MSRFRTLMQREWMQHHRGWLVLLFAPPLLVLLLLALPYATVQVGPVRPLEIMLITSIAVPVVMLGLAVVALSLQAPGLARRDRQDRSIEFWLSLPTSHAASIGAMVLVHALLVPLLALACGWVLSQLIGLVLVAKVFGLAGWAELPWGLLATAGVAALLRAAFGVLLASVWLLPILLTVMAASAWLKRWGVPVLVIIFWPGHLLLRELYGIGWLGDTLDALLANARSALLHGVPSQDMGHRRELIVGWLHDAPAWLAHDALASLADLAQPLFLFAIVASAAAFGLLVLRRSRNG